MHFHRLFLLLVYASVFFTANVGAQSLVSKLPPDGTYAKYEYSTKSTQVDGSTTYRKGVLLLKTLGTKKVDGKVHRWIELELRYLEGNGNLVPGQQFVNKILIPERNIEKQDSSILKNASEKWAQESWIEDGVKQTTGPMQVVNPWLFSLFQPVQAATKQLSETKTIKTPLGNLKCTGITFSVFPNEPNGKSSRKKTIHQYKCFRNEQTPFGSVLLQMDSKYSTGYKSTIHLKLASTGTGATTSIKDK